MGSDLSGPDAPTYDVIRGGITVDLFEVETVLYKLQSSKAISESDFKIVFHFIKDQDGLIEKLRQENEILRKELNPNEGVRMITKTG